MPRGYQEIRYLAVGLQEEGMLDSSSEGKPKKEQKKFQNS
jgi:hypothetical protein